MADESKTTTVDENLYSRQIGVYGLSTMKKLMGMRVLIVGLKGVGVETGAYTAAFRCLTASTAPAVGWRLPGWCRRVMWVCVLGQRAGSRLTSDTVTGVLVRDAQPRT